MSSQPALVLMERDEPLMRLAAHLELGDRARVRAEVDMAEFHYREALDLDPTDERPRDALHRLGLATTEPEEKGGFLTWMRGRLARKA